MNIARKYLVLIGWLLVTLVVALSLVKIGAIMPEVKNGDKVGHFIAYFTLMLWFAWLYPKPLSRNLYAISFILMGAVMEFLQSLISYRSADIEDFHVNTLGVIVGFIFAVLLGNIPIVKKTFKL